MENVRTVNLDDIFVKTSELDLEKLKSGELSLKELIEKNSKFNSNGYAILMSDKNSHIMLLELYLLAIKNFEIGMNKEQSMNLELKQFLEEFLNINKYMLNSYSIGNEKKDEFLPFDKMEIKRRLTNLIAKI